MPAVLRNIAPKILRCLLALTLAFMCLSAAMIGQLAHPLRAFALGGEPTKISLKAYFVDEQGDWDIKQGKQTTIATNGGQLRISVGVTYSDGVVINETDVQDWSDKGAFAEGFLYEWDNDNALTVSSTGVITALSDGVTNITVTPVDEVYSGLSATIKITTANQGVGLMVKKIEIVKESGKAYGDDNVRFTELSGIQKLYVRVTYIDKSDSNAKVVYSNYPDAPEEETPPEGAFDTLAWDVGDTNYVSASVHDGVCSLKAIANATTQVFASITGGDTTKDNGMGAGVVFDVVGVSINNGKTVNGGIPADKLKVRVVYEADEKNIAKEKVYTPEEFEALGAITRTYTLTQGRGNYVTDEAYGVPLATLLADLEVSLDDVKYFSMAANDGANPGKITAKWLMKTTRYYFPNYDLGGSQQEREQVPTMLALADSWNQNTTVTGELNEGTRFRLVFGSATADDSSTDKSIKFIHTFTICLSGSAPSQHGDDDDPETEPETPETPGSVDNGGTGSGGQGTGTGGGIGTSTGTGHSGGSKTVGNVTQGGGQESSAGTVKAQDLTELTPESNWSIYQMMNKSDTYLDIDYGDNPLKPYVIPVTIALLVLAGLWRALVFKRRIRVRSVRT